MVLSSMTWIGLKQIWPRFSDTKAQLHIHIDTDVIVNLMTANATATVQIHEHAYIQFADIENDTLLCVSKLTWLLTNEMNR